MNQIRGQLAIVTKDKKMINEILVGYPKPCRFDIETYEAREWKVPFYEPLDGFGGYISDDEVKSAIIDYLVDSGVFDTCSVEEFEHADAIQSGGNYNLRLTDLSTGDFDIVCYAWSDTSYADKQLDASRS